MAFTRELPIGRPCPLERNSRGIKVTAFGLQFGQLSQRTSNGSWICVGPFMGRDRRCQRLDRGRRIALPGLGPREQRSGRQDLRRLAGLLLPSLQQLLQFCLTGGGLAKPEVHLGQPLQCRLSRRMTWSDRRAKEFDRLGEQACGRLEYSHTHLRSGQQHERGGSLHRRDLPAFRRQSLA